MCDQQLTSQAPGTCKCNVSPSNPFVVSPKCPAYSCPVTQVFREGIHASNSGQKSQWDMAETRENWKWGSSIQTIISRTKPGLTRALFPCAQQALSVYLPSQEFLLCSVRLFSWGAVVTAKLTVEIGVVGTFLPFLWWGPLRESSGLPGCWVICIQVLRYSSAMATSRFTG